MHPQESTPPKIAANDDDVEDADTTAQPDANTDRAAPSGDASADRAPDKNRKPPMTIKQIEELEDDAPGG